MEPLLPFKTAMANALLENRESKADFFTSIGNGTSCGELWRHKQLRLGRALDVWSGLPRLYFGGN